MHKRLVSVGIGFLAFTSFASLLSVVVLPGLVERAPWTAAVAVACILALATVLGGGAVEVVYRNSAGGDQETRLLRNGRAVSAGNLTWTLPSHVSAFTVGVSFEEPSSFLVGVPFPARSP